MIINDGGGSSKPAATTSAKPAASASAKPAASTSTSTTSSTSSTSGSGTSSDNVNLTDSAAKEQERQRIEDEKKAAMEKLEEERKEKEKALEEERQAREKKIEEERKAELKAIEEEKAQKEKELEEQKLAEEEKAKKQKELEAEIEAKKKAVEEQTAAKKQALQEEMTKKKEAIHTDYDVKVSSIDTDYQNQMSAVNGPTLPPDFNNMTPEQQYNYLHDITVAMAGGDESQWRTGNDEVNLIGIRSWQNGQAGTSEGNKYNDTIYAVRMHDGKPEIYAFNGSVDAGVDPGGTGYGYSGPEGSGFSHVADGSYPIGTFEKRGGGKWGVDTTLGQSGNVNINVDFNNDAVIQDNERINKTEGAGWGIYFHPGGSGENVGSWSAGCQVIRPEQYGTFQSLIQQDPNQKFGYTLVDSANLPQVDSNNVAVGVPNTPTVANGTGGYSYTGNQAVPATGTTYPAANQGSTPTSPAINSTGDENPYALPSQFTNIPLPQGYVNQPGANPFGALNPLAPYMNLEGSDIDSQFDMLCQAAMQEVAMMQNQQGGAPSMGMAVMSLYMTYANSILKGVAIKAETEEKITSTLAMAGINAAQLKQTMSDRKNMLQGMNGATPFTPQQQTNSLNYFI